MGLFNTIVARVSALKAASERTHHESIGGEGQLSVGGLWAPPSGTPNRPTGGPTSTPLDAASDAPFAVVATGNPIPPRRRRWGLLVLGIAISSLGLLAIVGGMVTSGVGDALARLDPVAESMGPGVVRFEAEARRYDIKLASRRRAGDPETQANATRCTVTLADSRTIEIDGSRQAIASSSGNVASVGGFDAVAGPTSVACDGMTDRMRFVVDERSRWENLAQLVALSGVGVLLAGVALLLLGVFWRKPAVAS